MLKKAGLPAVFLAFLLILTSCAAGGAPSDDSASLSGGVAAPGANLREVSVEMQGNDTSVQLSFVSGSRFGELEETKLSSVPPYEVTVLNDPPRICVALDVDYADYAQAGTVYQGSLVQGLFDCALADAGITELFLQLTGPADVSVCAEGPTLELRLAPQPEAQSRAWFTGLNAMPQYKSGIVPDELRFAPTLCEGKSALILISDPFGSREEALAFAGQAEAALPASVPSSALYVFEMSTDALPPYKSIAVSDLAAAQPVLELNENPVPVTIVLDNGRYLTTGPDGTIVYAVPYYPGDAEEAGSGVREEVWGKSPDGAERRWGPADSCSVQSAAFSADGRYLAVLDSDMDSQILYVCDTDTGAVQNLGEEGFGDMTISFAWDTERDIIYAMTGTETSLQLLKYDFDAPAGARVSALEERNGAYSSLVCVGGRLYFANPEDGMICFTETATGERTALTPGLSFAVSGDGRYLAVLTPDVHDENGSSFDVQLADAETGRILSTVAERAQVSNLMFGKDPDRLYFLTQDGEGASQEFPFALRCYSVSGQEAQLLGCSRTDLVRPGADPGTLYLICYYAADRSQQEMLPVTYLLRETAG